MRMPAVAAACSLKPTARMRNPNVDLESSHQVKTAAAKPMIRARLTRRLGLNEDRSVGSIADSSTGLETRSDLVSEWRKLVPSAHTRNSAAMLLSMIEEMTSWAPVAALRTPGTAPRAPPARPPAMIARGRWSQIGRSRLNPTMRAPIMPKMSWPWAPMLNSPARNARPTARPVKMSGVA
nr:hypothetical protein GCM10025732_02860 [Glycomyces mayteni]